MADPLSVTPSIIAVVTLGLQSTKSVSIRCSPLLLFLIQD